MIGKTNHIYYPYIQTNQREYANNGSTNKEMGKGDKWKI